MTEKLLLISNSKVYGRGYLEHCTDELINFLGPVKSLLFVPYALHDKDAYTAIVRDHFRKMQIEVTSIHQSVNPIKAVEAAQAIFIGGGNTFRLLTELYKNQLIEIIRQKVHAGMLYIGSSAGSNVACPTIKTTNDMPIIYPPSFDALHLVSFQINPHYIDTDPNSTHMGETREQRIREFLEENNLPVIGLREGNWLRVENGQISLKGTTGARVFRRGAEPIDYTPPTMLTF